MKTARSIALLSALLLLTACGTTSDIKPSAAGAAPAAPAAPETASATSASLPYGEYSTVVVLDFDDGTDQSTIPSEKQLEYSETMKIAVRNFADRIAGEIRKTGAFDEVLREPSSGKSLLIKGVITRYATGNALLRLFVGFGAGSSYFDATVNLSDNASGESLGQVTVDRNSWGLGGAIAASQSVEGFMQGAAEKIAKDLAEAKSGSATSRSTR